MTSAGNCVSDAGDINGDGIGDVIVGASWADINAGLTVIVFGQNNKTRANIDLLTFVTGPNTGFRIIAADAGVLLGYSVSNAGDVNGDGVDDLITGAWRADVGGKVDAGISYVIFGRRVTVAADNAFTDIQLTNTVLAAEVGFRILGAAAGDHSGAFVSSAGDVNSDGIDDIIVGADSADNPTIGGDNNAGMVYVIFGKNMTGESGAVGDVDLSGIETGSVLGFRIIGAATNNHLGLFVSNAGDVNGDGVADIVIGACHANGDAGIAYVIFGRNVTSPAHMFEDIELSTTALAANVGFRVLGAAADDLFGSPVSNAGDVNGDGVDDIIIGAHQADPPGYPFNSFAGIVYVIFGRDIPNGAAPFGDILASSFTSGSGIGFRLFGTVVSTTGFSVSGAGDVNDDGIDDIVIGAPYAEPPDDQLDAGVSYIIYGRKSVVGSVVFEDIYLSSVNISSDIGFCILGAYDSDHSGFSVSGAGDVNGDTVDDLLVGTELGSSYVIYGTPASPTSQPNSQPGTQPTTQPSMLVERYPFAEVDLRDIGEIRGFTMNSAGNCVSEAGDVNGDGIGDVIIGAYFLHSNTGVTIVLFGQKNTYRENIDLQTFVTGPDTGFRVMSLVANVMLGYSVSSAGDVNGDGVDDIMTGAFRANVDGKVSAGITYVIFGRRVTAAAGNAFTDIQLTDTAMAVDIGFRILGAAAGDLSGYSVSGAGDVQK